MALPRYALEILAPLLKGAKVLSLGYPDILATQEDCEAIFGVKPTDTIDAGAQHNVHRPLVETMGLMKLLGSTLDCVDVIQFRGFERVLDLNDPHDLGEYDLVIDPGTTEHCFNIGQAVMNAARAVRVGGRIYHSPPMFMINHGFYNVCPTMLWDFYTQNGWSIELFEARVGDSAPVKIDARNASKRRVKVGLESGLVCVARRLTAAALRFPVQQKYLRAMSAHKLPTAPANDVADNSLVGAKPTCDVGLLDAIPVEPAHVANL